MGIAAGVIAAQGAKEQVTFGEAGTGAAQDTSSPLSVPYPANIVAGSFLVLHVLVQASASASITTPAGWTLVTGLNIAATARDFVYFKIADGSESGSLDVTFGGTSAEAFGRMYRFSHGSGVEAASSASQTADTTIESEAVTSTVPLAMVVQCLTHLANATIAVILGSNASYSEAAAEFGDANMPATISCQVATLATPTAVTSGSATAGSSAGHNAHGFVIKP